MELYNKQNGRDWGVNLDQRAELDGVSLLYGKHGKGEPVLVIHGVLIADAVIPPLQLRPEIFEHYEFIGYYRAGYHGSTCDEKQISIETHAEHVRQLLDHLELEKVHLVSYSFGGLVAMQVMLSYPERVHTSVMLEPYLPRESQTAIEDNTHAFTEAFALYEQGHMLAAAQSYQAGICGDRFLASVDLTCSRDVWDKVTEATSTVFTVDMPAYMNWGFRPSQADDAIISKKPDMPVLAVMGADSESVVAGFQETQAFLLDWLPQAERCGIPYATHGLQMMNPSAVAESIMHFLQKHPLA